MEFLTEYDIKVRALGTALLNGGSLHQEARSDRVCVPLSPAFRWLIGLSGGIGPVLCVADDRGDRSTDEDGLWGRGLADTHAPPGHSRPGLPRFPT